MSEIGVIDRWMRRLVSVSVGDVPDDILEAMPEVSRLDEPQVSPQEYACGCVVVTRVTDRDCRTWRVYGEKPFEMRLAMSCDGSVCELARLRMDQRDGDAYSISQNPALLVDLAPFSTLGPRVDCRSRVYGLDRATVVRESMP